MNPAMNKLNGVLARLQSRPELIVLCLVILIVAMLIVPMPAYVLDFLIGFNIVTALLVFMGSFYIVNILNFSTFPSILLITTMFRLALSISTSRLILLEADAGQIIQSFGQFVIGDNLVVGFVVFAIVTVVQFIVITKGSERVAEVAARFSLDGMPGKQMSIDADLRAGVIDIDGVKVRRTNLERESQLYGSFDGAMKFIKGDAIAGIIIIFVNLIGGISVGMAQHGMDLSQALSTYTILTIGDGLVAQIPALLIAIGAGFVVTLVGGNSNNLGQNIVAELFSNHFVLLVTALLALCVGLLPGFPLAVFVLIAGVLGYMYFRKVRPARNKSRPGKAGSGRTGQPGQAPASGGADGHAGMDEAIPETVPLMLLAPEASQERIEGAGLASHIRRQVFIDYGIRMPELHIRYSPNVDPAQVIVLVNEIRAATFHIHFGRSKAGGAVDMLNGLSLDVAELPDGSGGTAHWVEEAQASALTKMGLPVRSDLEELYEQFVVLLLKNITEFFGVQETKSLLDDMEKKYPELLKETYRHASVQRISEIFQRLLNEKISIRNMKLILEALAQWAAREKDPVMLAEHVRGALARYISHKFASAQHMSALVLSSETEDQIRQGIRQTSGGTFFNLEPVQTEALLDLIALGLNGIGYSQRDLVLLTSVDVRRFAKRLVESRFGGLEVLSFGEISDDISIDVLKTI